MLSAEKKASFDGVRVAIFGCALGAALTLSLYDPATLYHQSNSAGIGLTMPAIALLQWTARIGAVVLIFFAARFERKRGMAFWSAAAVGALLTDAAGHAAGKDLDHWPLQPDQLIPSTLQSAPQTLLAVLSAGLVSWVLGRVWTGLQPHRSCSDNCPENLHNVR